MKSDSKARYGVSMEEKNYFMWLNVVLFGRVAGS
jgi:hypothetical protein